MTALLNALRTVPADKILEFLMRKSPQLKSKITSALSSGVSAEKIIKFFSKDKNFDKLKGSMEQDYPMEGNANPLVQAQNVRSQNLGTDMASGLQRMAGPALGAAAAAGTTYALSRAIPSILQSTGILNPSQAPSPAQKTPQIPSSQQPPLVPQAQAPVLPNIPQVAQPTQAQGIPTTPTINPSEILSKHNIKEKVDDILKNRNTPEAVSAYYEKFSPKIKKTIEKETGLPFEKVISDYSAQAPKTGTKPLISNLKIGDKFITRKEEEATLTELSDKTFEFKTQKETRSGPLSSLEYEMKSETPKIEKASVVATPHGIGEVKSIKEENALVEVDGKLQKVPIEELIESPIPEKDLADLYDDLIQGIQKTTGKQVSRNVEWAGFDPKVNELVYKPHGSDKVYAYDEISPEDVEQLTNLLTQRKSTGENFIGAWEAGTESPIGAAMYQLIKKLQAERGGKGNEYKNRFETIYDALEPAKLAAKKRYEERKKKAKKSGIA